VEIIRLLFDRFHWPAATTTTTFWQKAEVPFMWREDPKSGFSCAVGNRFLSAKRKKYRKTVQEASDSGRH
jgi:hypothetical protein